MNMPAGYTDALERALGQVIARTRDECERQVELVTARADAVIARLEARNAELEARASGIERAVSEQVAAGIEAGLAAIKEAIPDDAPVRALAEKVAELETRAPDLSPVEERLAALEAQEGPDLTGFVTKDDLAEAMPSPPDLSPLRADIEKVMQAIPAAPDLSGYASTDDLETLRNDLGAVRDAIPEVPEPKDWTPEIEAIRKEASGAVDGMRAEVDKAKEELADRFASHPGKFPMVREWTDRVHYAGELAVRDGSLWQAQRDTGKPPAPGDWECLIEKGEKGDTGRSFTVRGTYSPEESYQALDVVMLDGSSFVAKHDDPGSCPGDGWQLAASRGGRGKQGDPGKSIPGKPGEPVVSADVSEDGLLTLTNGDGSTVEVDLYPLLARLK